MLKRISIKHALAAVVVLLIACGALLEYESQILADQRSEIQKKWLNFEAQRSEKARIYASLLAKLGYGGMIHNFKNYVLRKTPPYRDATRNDVGAVRAIIAQYLTVHTDQEELIAIHSLGNMLADYEKALSQASILIAVGPIDAAELDNSLRADHETALQALNTLGDIIQRELGDAARNSKPVLAAGLRRTMGYDGFIHAFKNYVIRGDATYADRARVDMAAAMRIIDEWRRLPLTQNEELALRDMANVLGSYRRGLDVAKEMIAAGTSPERIDAAVMVDSYPVIRGMAVLDRAIAMEIAQEFTEVHGRFITAAGLAEIRDWTTRGVIVLLIFAAGFLMYFMIIRPLRRIEKVMSALAAGDLSVDIPGTDLNNEIGNMARAIGVFKETAQRLQESRDEMEVTVLELTDTQDRLENQAADLAEMAESLEFERQRVEKLSITDRLTGLYNRQKLDQVIAEEAERAKRYDHPLTLILFDVDHFKSVNDTHGHLVGDQVLTGMAQTVSESIRAVDIAGRWGGEEFMVICPETDIAGCTELAEKIRKAIESVDFPVVGRKTASFGIAKVRTDEKIDAAIQRADEALYSAKQHGRNRVELAA